ncbi:hypothetical protein [Roseisolibacter sp. H3M3-2]|uniref:hypothetical protein n=1 Tax=Roseisolibacter sp. H3M3-2 TaxID=3031323 RepID=UPI0023DA6A71|nr:hypothetical protein [Roseisolibacter sp. H3M3-2]MDF1504832.1 hypothetical protein [Roseisolibacter sp. H3M3-2]
MSLLRPLLGGAVALLLAAPVAAPLAAQAPAAPRPVRQAIGVNALALPFGLFSAEYEVALPTPGFAFGIGGSWLTTDVDDDDYDASDRDAWVELKGLYYPGERPFRGFSLGLSLGVHSARNSDGGICDFNGCRDAPRRSQTAPTAGVLVSYDWLLGRAERFRVGLGVGAKRTLRDVRRNDPLEQVYPDGRFIVGVAF